MGTIAAIIWLLASCWAVIVFWRIDKRVINPLPTGMRILACALLFFLWPLAVPAWWLKSNRIQ